MSYVDSSLLPGETVIHRARLHKVLFVFPGLITVILVLAGFWLNQNPPLAKYAGFCFLLAFLLILPPYIHYMTSEFAVTNKRVIVKVGFISRRTLETLLQRIEAISVDQSILGRILNFGTITVIGTGGTQESFDNIADPLGFRRAVQEQTDAKDSSMASTLSGK